MATQTKTTPLFASHKQLGARIVDFADWQMPVQYSGIIAEHTAVRTNAGLFDVSHMGEFVFSGPGALANLQELTANDVSTLVDGQAQYSLILNEDGGIIDDIIVYRRHAEEFLVVVNAGNLDTDWHWVFAHRGEDVELKNRSNECALIALQGPAADTILQALTPADLPSIHSFCFADATVANIPTTIARTGYTGEKGFEIFTAADDATTVWQALLETGQPQGLIPCGLAARDTLRLEMAYPLHGNEISTKTSPLEARLTWVVKLDKGPFIGRDALLKQAETGCERQLVGFVMNDSGIPRHGYSLIVDNKPVGFVTSGTMSPTLKKGIGLGYIPKALAQVGAKISVDIRGNERVAEVVKLPFYLPRRQAGQP